jgi:peptidyl-prolyl cis-trans isomerase SurA
MRKILFFIVAGIILVLPALSFSEVIVDKIVAVVGDKVLTLYQLNKMCKPFFEKIPDTIPEERKERFKNEIRKEVLNVWIQDAVIRIEAEKYGLEISDEEIKKVLENEIKARGGKENFYKFLREYGYTYDEYLKKLKEDLTKMKLIQSLVHEKVMVTEEEVKKAYEEYIKKNKFEKGYELSLLLIHSDNKTAYRIYEDLLKGKDFEEIAEEYRNVVNFIKKVKVKKSELSEEILRELENAKEKNIIPPVKIDDTYEIIKILKVFSGKPPSFSELRDYFYREIYNKKAQKFLEKWIKELKQKRYIRVYL